MDTAAKTFLLDLLQCLEETDRIHRHCREPFLVILNRARAENKNADESPHAEKKEEPVPCHRLWARRLRRPFGELGLPIQFASSLKNFQTELGNFENLLGAEHYLDNAVRYGATDFCEYGVILARDFQVRRAFFSHQLTDARARVANATFALLSEVLPLLTAESKEEALMQ